MSSVRAAVRHPSQIHVAARQWRQVTGYLSSPMLVCFLFNHVVVKCKLELWPSVMVSFEQTEGKTVLAYLPRLISLQTMLVSGKTTTFLVAQDDHISVYFVNISLLT